MPACPILFYIVGNRVLHIQSKFHVFRSFRSKTRAKISKIFKKKLKNFFSWFLSWKMPLLLNRITDFHNFDTSRSLRLRTFAFELFAPFLAVYSMTGLGKKNLFPSLGVQHWPGGWLPRYLLPWTLEVSFSWMFRNVKERSRTFQEQSPKFIFLLLCPRNVPWTFWDIPEHSWTFFWLPKLSRKAHFECPG
jgi:hypothetical protein